MSGVIVEVNAQTGRSEERLDAINRSLKNIESSSKDTSMALGGMVKTLLTIGTTAISGVSLQRISDEFTNMSNQIALVTGRTKELTAVQLKLSSVAKDTFSSVASTSNIFASLGRSMKQAGVGTSQIVKATATVQRAIALSGANAQTSAGALLQLSQGLSSGTLRGEELNSVLEGTPRLAQAIADSLGVTTGKLRIIASEGQLTSEKVFGALLQQSKALENEFSSFKPTLAQAGALFSDSFKRAVNEFDKGLGISDAIAASLGRSGTRMTKLADSAFDFGNNLRVGILKTIGNSKLLFGPIFESMKELGGQFLQIFSHLSIGRTLRGEFKGALASFDAFTGGMLTAVSRFSFASLFDLRTPVEDAIRQIKRLNPANWVGFGFNKETFTRIFNLEYLHSVGAAFLNLRNAIKGNSDSIFTQLDIFGDEVAFFATKTIKYFDLTQNAFSLLKPGNSEAFFTSMEGIVRGLSGVSIKIWDTMSYLKRLMAPAFDAFILAMHDSVGTFAKGIAAGMFAVGKGIVNLIKDIVLALASIRTGFSVKHVFGGILDGFDSLTERFNNATSFDKVAENFKRVTDAIAGYFDFLDTSVIRSSWTSAINYALDVVDSFVEGAVTQFSKVSSFITKTMKSVGKSIVRGFNDLIPGDLFGGSSLKSQVSEFKDLLASIGSSSFSLTSFAGISETFSSVLDKVKDTVSRFVQFIDTSFEQVSGSVVGEKLQAITASLNDIFKELFGSYSVYIGKMADGMANALQRVADAVLDLAIKAVDAALSIGSDAGAGSLAKSLKNSMLADFYDLFDISGRAMNLFAQTFNAVAAIAVAGLRVAIHYVRVFAENTIHEFFRIYDEVIGHSWWTDTIETIVDTSGSLWERASGGLQKFRSKVSGLFEDIFQQKRSFNIDSITANFDSTKFQFPEVDTQNLVTSIERFTKVAVDKFKVLFDQFPEMARVALTAVGAVLLAVLFPAGKIKTILLSTLVSSIISQSTLLGEAFGMAITGHSFISAIASAAGSLAGFITSSIIKEIPQIIDVMLTVASSFTKAFVEQLPIIGSMLSSVFGAVSAGVGSGPLGLVGLILFGKGVVGIMKEFNIGTEALGTFEKGFQRFSKYISGDGGGFISKYLFGIPGPQRVISAFMLVLDAMGTFDSFFAGSEILHLAGEAGLLYTLFYGKNGYDKVKDTAGDAVHYVTDILKKGIKQMMAGTKLGDVLFDGTSGADKGGKLETFLKDTFANINRKMVDAATPYFEQGFDIVKKLLLGKNPELTKAGIVAYFAEMKDTMISAVQKIREPLARAYDKISEKMAAFNHSRKRKQQEGANKSIDAKDFISDIPDAIDRLRRRFGDNKRKPEDVGSAFDFSGLRDKITDIAGRFGFRPKVDTKKFTDDVKSMKSTVASTVSESGLLGMLFFGKYSKYAWVAILATVISTAATAATNDIGKSSTPFEDMLNNWKDFKLENPFVAVAAEITAVTLPLLLGAIIIFRKQAASLFAGIVSDQSIANIGAGIGTLVGKMRSYIPAIKAGLAGGVGAAMGYAIGDWAGGPEMAQIGLLMGATMLAGFGSSVLSAVGSVLAAIGSAIIGAIGWIGVAIATAVVAGLGALYVYFFGESGEFFTDLARAKDEVLELLHLKDKTDKPSGLPPDNAAFLRNIPSVKMDYDLGSINFNNVKSSDKDGLQKSIDELGAHIESLRNEERKYGKVSPASVDTTNTLLEGLKVYTDKLSAKSAFDPEKFGETLKDLRQGNPRNIAQRLKIADKQFTNDFVYKVNSSILEAGRYFAAQGNKAKWTDRLEVLKSERDTRYNAKYRPLGVLEETLINFESGSKNFQDSSPAQLALTKTIEKMKDAYLRGLQEVRKKEGGSLFDPVGDPNYQLDAKDPLNMKLQKTGGDLLAAYFKKFEFEKHAGDIRVFNADLDSLTANLKEVGITFDSKTLFAKDSASSDFLVSLSKEAKELADQLKVTRDVAERNKIIVRIEEIRTSTQKEANKASVNDNMQKQYQLKDRLSKIGINNFSDDIYKFLDDKTAEDFNKRSINIENRQLDNQRKSVSAMKAAGVGNEKDLPAIIRKNFETEVLNIRNAVERLQKDIETAVQSSLSAGNAFNEMARTAGADFGKMIQSSSPEKAILGLNDLTAKAREAKTALDLNDIDAWQRLNVEIETLRDRLQMLPMNFSEVTAQLGALGSTVSLDDVFTLSRGTLYALEGAAKGMREIDFILQHERGDINPDKLKAFAEQKLKLLSIAKEATVQISHSTGEKLSQMLSGSGFGDAFEQSTISSKMLDDFRAMDIEIQRIKNDLADPRNVKQFSVLQNNLYNAQQFVKKMRDDLRGFDGRFDITNSAFNTNMSKQEFANLQPQTAFNLSTQAQAIADKLADAGKRFISEGSYEAFTAYGKLLADQRVSAFDANKRAQGEGAKYKSDVDNIPRTGTSDLIDLIVSVVPELGEMRTNLELLNRQGLEVLAKQTLEIADRKRNIDLGLSTETIGSLVKDRQRFSDSTAMSLVTGGQLGSRVTQAGGNLDKDAFGRVSRKAITDIDTLAGKINQQKDALKSPGLSVESRNKIQDQIDQMFIQMEDAIKAATVNRHRIAYEAGQNFASSIIDGFSTAFTGLIQQKTEEGKTAWTTFRDAVFTLISENVIKTFVDGLSNAVMGEGSPIRNALANIGSNIFSQFRGVGSTDEPSTPDSEEGGIIDSIAGFFAPVTGALSAIFGATSSGDTATTVAINSSTLSIVAAINTGAFSIVSALTAGTASNSVGTGLRFLQLASSVASGTSTGVVSPADQSAMILDLNAFATGGIVRGPGTGTSDSIPAMLSNGEYVINAAQTAKFKPMLEAINNGNMSFAAGGLVTPAPYVTPTMASSVSNSSTQHITLNITGDISRQTKQEVHKLIPMIATGINAHNRERMI